MNFNDVANFNSQRFVYIQASHSNKNKFAINNNHPDFPTTSRCCTGPTESESMRAVQHAKLEGTMFQVITRWFKVHELNLCYQSWGLQFTPASGKGHHAIVMCSWNGWRFWFQCDFNTFFRFVILWQLISPSIVGNVKWVQVKAWQLAIITMWITWITCSDTLENAWHF